MHSERPDNQEITYKIASRGAWLAGADPDERHRYFKELQHLYRLRSKAVHSGMLKVDNAIAEMTKLGAGEDLCAKLIIRLLERGQWPDWTKLVLGNPDA